MLNEFNYYTRTQPHKGHDRPTCMSCGSDCIANTDDNDADYLQHNSKSECLLCGHTFYPKAEYKLKVPKGVRKNAKPI